jgi:hypothetical protein
MMHLSQKMSGTLSLRVRLQFIHEFKDRHGRVRRYFRRRGMRLIPLPGKISEAPSS